MDKDPGNKVHTEQARRLRLEMTVSDMILDLVREAAAGELDDVPNGDVQAICEGLAMRIIEEVNRTDMTEVEARPEARDV
jgi:hypothetical protein